MSTTDEIFNGFKSLLIDIEDEDLRKRLGVVVLSSIRKHRANDLTIIQLKKNMEAQKKLFISNLEGLEDKACPHPQLAKAGAHH